MSRQLWIDVIRTVVEDMPADEIRTLAGELPATPLEGTYEFCKRYELGFYFGVEILRYEISPAYELYEYLKEVEASGDKQHGTST